MAMQLAIEDPSVDGARAGDPVAWADLYERFHPVIVRYLEIVAPEADPEEVWEKAAHALGGQPVGVNPVVWLLRVARELRVGHPEPEATDNPAVAAVRQLPTLQMEIVAVRVVGGLDTCDTAAVVGWPPQRVESAAHSALGALIRQREHL